MRIFGISLVLAGSALAATVSGNIVLVQPGAKKARDNSGVVVWLEPAGAAARPAPATTPRATMTQKNKTFIPHVLAVEAGTAVDFPNVDPIFHNAFSNYDGQIFDVQLYAPKTSRRVVFRRPGMVRVFCNIHATMSAVIAVLPTPYFTVTGSNGRFEIHAPAGAYRFQVWHERAQAERLQTLERPLTLGEGNVSLPEISISEEDYVAVPHKNKYGREYRPPPQDTVFYPGGHR